jgi:hypothetical protein
MLLDAQQQSSLLPFFYLESLASSSRFLQKCNSQAAAVFS